MASVAVLMAAYNAEKTIRQSVNSVWASTYPAQLFIVDDCSRIPVSEIFPVLPSQTEIIRLDVNAGPAMARNIGLRTILARKYDYVAIADADDISYPDRVGKQVAFLEANPEIAVVGSWVRFIDDITGKPLFNLMPSPDTDVVRKLMFFNLNLSHTSCMIRCAALAEVGLYSTRYPAAEDYELMRRIAAHYDISNVPEFLTDYRISTRGISVTRRRRQLFDRLCIQLKFFEPLEWRAWAGAAQTAVLFFIPLTVVIGCKAGLRSFADLADRGFAEPRRMVRTLLQPGDLLGKVWGRRYDTTNQ